MTAKEDFSYNTSGYVQDILFTIFDNTLGLELDTSSIGSLQVVVDFLAPYAAASSWPALHGLLNAYISALSAQILPGGRFQASSGLVTVSSVSLTSATDLMAIDTALESFQVFNPDKFLKRVAFKLKSSVNFKVNIAMIVVDSSLSQKNRIDRAFDR